MVLAMLFLIIAISGANIALEKLPSTATANRPQCGESDIAAREVMEVDLTLPTTQRVYWLNDRACRIALPKRIAVSTTHHIKVGEEASSSAANTQGEQP